MMETLKYLMQIRWKRWPFSDAISHLHGLVRTDVSWRGKTDDVTLIRSHLHNLVQNWKWCRNMMRKNMQNYTFQIAWHIFHHHIFTDLSIFHPHRLAEADKQLFKLHILYSSQSCRDLYIMFFSLQIYTSHSVAGLYRSKNHVKSVFIPSEQSDFLYPKFIFPEFSI